MTLLTICTDAADEIPVVRPTSIIGNADPGAQKFLRLAKKVGNRLMKVYPWQALRKEQTFSALGQEEQTAILPSDFDRFVPETFWDRTNNYLISGPITAVEWQGFKANSYVDPQPKFIYRGDSIFIQPARTAGDSLAFEYVSNLWCTDSGGTGQTTWAADTDLGVIDEELMTRGLIWEWRSSEGLPANVQAEAYKTYFDTLVKNDQPGPNIMIAGDIFNGGYRGARHFSGTPTVSGSEAII